MGWGPGTGRGKTYIADIIGVPLQACQLGWGNKRHIEGFGEVGE